MTASRPVSNPAHLLSDRTSSVRLAAAWQRAAPGLLLILAAMLLLLLAPGSAWAQAGGGASQPMDIGQITGASPAGDWSLRMWKSIFGDFATNPFSTLGGPTSLLGGVFLIFNACVFSLGVVWLVYGVVSGVVATAHEGEVLGKRMSTVWYPIRSVLGIAGMAPVFGGFTLSQALMMFLTTIGIGIANLMWTGAVNNTAQFQGIMNSQPMQPTVVSDMRAAAHSMFVSNVCVLANKENEAERMLPAAQQMRVMAGPVPGKPNSYSLSYGNPFNLQKCGAVTVSSRPREGSSATGYRVASVNYPDIANAVNTAYVSGLESMHSQISVFADNWYRDYKASQTADGGVIPPVPQEELDAAVDQFLKNASAALRYNMDQSAITQAAKQNMLEVGWFGAGAWFGTFSEVNAAIADAARGPTVQSRPPLGGPIHTNAAREAMTAAAQKMQEGDGVRGKNGEGGQQALLDSAIRDSCMALGITSIGTATGNCSLGQAIVSAGIRSVAVGSGGGGTSNAGDLADRGGWVNPIVMIKNVGDYVMTISMTFISLGPVAELTGKVLNTVASAGTILGFATNQPALTTASSALGTAGAFIAVMQTIGMFLLVVGAAMAVYIPLVPVIVWLGCLVSYASSMIEGLAGATLHAMSHLDGDGDGLGQRTQHGYIYYLNAALRPGLMLIGFFTATTVLMAIGTLQVHLFMPAMANVQGNSITGLASIVMFLIIFMVLNLTLINASFGLIHVICDNVLGFIGNAVGSRLGQDTEDKANNLFLVAARVGPSAIGSVGSAKAEAKKAAKQAAGENKPDADGGRGGKK